jgi:hypothetical protein
MRSLPIGVCSLALLVAAPHPAWCEEVAPEAKAPGLPDEPAAATEDEARRAAANEERRAAEDEAARPRTVEERLAALEDELERHRQALTRAQEAAARPSPITLVGYVDFGLFVPQGDGSGWVQDFGNVRVPSLAGKYAWVFLGDLLATPVNSRGEAASLGNAPGVQRFDSVHSRGAPGFLLNEVNFGLSVDLGHRLVVNSSVNFVPRTGSNFSIGDFLEVDLAQLEWVVDEAQTTSIFVGKINPALGIEYKERRSDQRFGITPSLTQRYTSGSQLGLKVRSKLFGGWLVLAGVVANGSTTTEQFHFYDEVDSNAGKNVSGRVALHVPVGELFAGAAGHTLEVGLSGEVGPQDRALDNKGDIWFWGVDVEYRGLDFSVKGQFLRGGAPGNEADGAYALVLNGTGYVELDWMFLPQLGALVALGYRDAFVSLGTERAYLTKAWRATFGLRAVLGPHVILKAEYLRNGEYGEVPWIRDDLFTSSLVLHY